MSPAVEGISTLSTSTVWKIVYSFKRKVRNAPQLKFTWYGVAKFRVNLSDFGADAASAAKKRLPAK
jgi:hypothetical protein